MFPGTSASTWPWSYDRDPVALYGMDGTLLVIAELSTEHANSV
jgi:hypothetical protein